MKSDAVDDVLKFESCYLNVINARNENEARADKMTN